MTSGAAACDIELSMFKGDSGQQAGVRPDLFKCYYIRRAERRRDASDVVIVRGGGEDAALSLQ